jgi:ribosomal protein S18 acetylase RimI-like enzyme
MTEPSLPPPLTDTSGDGLRRAIEADQVASRLYNSDLPVEAHDEPDASWAIAPFGDVMRSVVVRAAFDDVSADRRIDDIVASYDAVGNPILWWLNPSDTPPDLPQRLARRGFEYVAESPGMALDLAALNSIESPVDGLSIEPVRDEVGAREFVGVVNEDRPEGVPPSSAESAQSSVRLIAQRVTTRKIPTYFLGRLDGRAVATSKLSLVGGTAGIYSVVTLAEARGGGIGTSMTLAAMNAGREAGYRIATLQSSDMGYRLYERLGFRDVFRYRIHVRQRPSAEKAVASDGEP